jgi:hypothetical protein
MIVWRYASTSRPTAELADTSGRRCWYTAAKSSGVSWPVAWNRLLGRAWDVRLVSEMAPQGSLTTSQVASAASRVIANVVEVV